MSETTEIPRLQEITEALGVAFEVRRILDDEFLDRLKETGNTQASNAERDVYECVRGRIKKYMAEMDELLGALE